MIGNISKSKGFKGDKGDKGDRGIDGTVTFDELTDEQKASLKGDKGDVGPQGPQGPIGPQGDTGPKGEKGDSVTVDNTLTKTGEAADAKAVGDALKDKADKASVKGAAIGANAFIYLGNNGQLYIERSGSGIYVKPKDIARNAICISCEELQSDYTFDWVDVCADVGADNVVTSPKGIEQCIKLGVGADGQFLYYDVANGKFTISTHYKASAYTHIPLIGSNYGVIGGKLLHHFNSTSFERLNALEEIVNKLYEKSLTKTTTINLSASAWVEDSENKYSQVVSVNGVTPYSKVDLQPTSEQLAVFHEKDIAFVAENDDGVITIYCIGQRPVNSYIIQATITEVEIDA